MKKLYLTRDLKEIGGDFGICHSSSVPKIDSKGVWYSRDYPFIANENPNGKQMILAFIRLGIFVFVP